MSEGKEKPKIQPIEIGTAYKLNRHIGKLIEAEKVIFGLRKKMQGLLEQYRLNVPFDAPSDRTAEGIEQILANLDKEEAQLDGMIKEALGRVRQIADRYEQLVKEIEKQSGEDRNHSRS